MFRNPRSAAVLAFLFLLHLVVTGCGRERALLPTAVSPSGRAPGSEDSLDARAADLPPSSTRVRYLRHLPSGSVAGEAREALGAVYTGEQVYFQALVTYRDAADIAEIRDELKVYLEALADRWTFSVSGATAVGFVATARGRDDTRAEGIVVTLVHQRGQPLAWTIERACRRRY